MKIKLTENQFQRIVKEMRFDGKSTGLFSEEEHIDEADVDSDGDKDVEDEELGWEGDPWDYIEYGGFMDDRFDSEQRIKSTMNEYFSEPKDKYNKWDRLERDVDSCIRSIIETHKDNFGYDSYGVIDAIYQIMDGMFQRV